MSEPLGMNAEARRLAAAALFVEGADPAALAETLRDVDWRVREEAIVRMRTYPGKHALVPVLVEALSNSTDIAYRNAAAAALAVVGSAALPQIATALAQMDEDARKLVAEICAQIPTEAAVAMLLELAVDGDENVRIAAFEALGHARDAGASCSREASALMLRDVRSAGPLLQLAALNALYMLASPIGSTYLLAWEKDPLLGPYAARAASGSVDVATLDTLADLACRGGEIADEAIAALARSGSIARGAVFFAVSRRGDALRMALETAAREGREGTQAAALDLLPAVFRPEHVALYVEGLVSDATADAAARSLAALAPLVGGHLFLNAEYTQMEGFSQAARVMAPQLDEDSARAVSRLLLSDPPTSLADAWVDILLLLPTWASDAPWGRVFDATQSDDTERVACELLTLRAARDAAWARDVLARALPGEASARVRAALLLGVARSEPLSALEARDVEVGIGSEDPLVRASSLLTAAQGAPVDRRTIISALADETTHVVIAAIGAAARAGCFRELEELASAATDAQVVVAALSALSSVAPDRVATLVRRRLSSSDERLAAAALSRMPLGDPCLVEMCEMAIARFDVPASLAALRLLVASDDPRAVRLVVRLLEHGRWEVRALAVSGVPVATERGALLARLEREENTTVSEAIRQRLRSA